MTSQTYIATKNSTNIDVMPNIHRGGQHLYTLCMYYTIRPNVECVIYNNTHVHLCGSIYVQHVKLKRSRSFFVILNKKLIILCIVQSKKTYLQIYILKRRKTMKNCNAIVNILNAVPN